MAASSFSAVGTPTSGTTLPWSAVLEGAVNHLLDVPAGHVSPLFLRRVEVQVAAWLEGAACAGDEAGERRETRTSK